MSIRAGRGRFEVEIAGPPALPLVSLADAKQHAGMFEDLTDDDAYMAGLVEAATEEIENLVQRSFVTRTYRATGGFFPRGRDPIRLDMPPLLSVVSIEYATAADVWATADPASYGVGRGTPALVGLAGGCVWPSPAWGLLQAVRVVYTAGYGPDPADSPARARHAVKMLAAHWYGLREPTSPGAQSPIPYTVEALCDGLRWGAFPE
jgi:uncharacterized phiE125 gp8 family phage protein